MAYSYLILGAGKQGMAAAYDILLHGNASRLVLADGFLPLAQAGLKRLRKLCGAQIRKQKISLSCARVSGNDSAGLSRILEGHDAALSALPYYLNPAVAKAAIANKVNYCDLGGYFDTTLEILKLDAKAKKAGVTLISDCGVSPGMCNSLAVCGMERLSRTDDVHIYCGGLPQKPKPPLHYKVVFNLEGVLGNYFGKAYVLKNGRIALVESFSGREKVKVPGIGTLEAVVTGGATSTCPWTFRGKVKNYDYKTLRYKGHYDKIQVMKDLGLFETAAVRVNGDMVVPRQLFVAAAGPKLHFPDDRDLLILRVSVSGVKNGRKTRVVYDVLDRQDPRTGFTAMQRTTGFSAAVVLAMLAQGRIHKKGASPVERSVPARAFLDAIRKRGINVRERTVTL